MHKTKIILIIQTSVWVYPLMVLMRYFIAALQASITIGLMNRDARMQPDKAVTVMPQAEVGQRACAVVDGRPVAGDDVTA
ncbi:hypothetical protein BK025_08820 [Sodalis sp. TME1]|nr:hypothetical protein BK025_08820 [Sodalis sp. TME1]